MDTEGNIGGTFSTYTAIQSTGYATTSRPTGTSALDNIQNTPTDVEQGGSALIVHGSVTGGIFLGAPPASTVSTNTTLDADGDGIVDSSEGTTTITTYGSSPAMVIGGTSAAINIGNVQTAFTAAGYATPTEAGQNLYGLVIEGTITGQGVFDGFSATALQVGGGGGTVNLNGGINVIGAVSTSAYSADATTIHLESGTIANALRNSGTISSTVTSSNANNASTLLIDAGATLNNLYNYGTISANVVGNTTNTYVVRDSSGTLTNVLNQGAIEAVYTAGTPGQPITPADEIALDIARAKSNVVLLQSLNGTVAVDGVEAADGTVSGGAVAPFIIGDVFLAQTYANTVNIDSGSVSGALNLGNAAGGSLELSGDSFYTGKLLYDQGLVATGASLSSITLNGATLQDNAATIVRTGSLSVNGSSTLIIALDPALSQAPTAATIAAESSTSATETQLYGTINRSNPSTEFIVSGNATFATGAKIGATLVSEPTSASQTFTIVQAGSLSVGSVSTLLSGLPYLFNGSLSIVGNSIDLTVTTKTPAELQLNKAETAAFPAIYAALPQDSAIQTAVLSADTRKTFLTNYDQLLPESGGDVFETALNFSKAVSRATAERFDLSTEKLEDEAPSRTGFWATEFYSGIDQQKQDNNTYHSAGLGVIGGFDFGGTGLTISAASANVTQPHSNADTLNSVSVVEGGAYAAPRWGPLSLDARIGAGFLKMTDHRQFIATEPAGDTSTATTITRDAEGDWSGYDLSGHLGAGLELDINRGLFFTPRVYADFFHVHEDAYNERNIGAPPSPTGFLLDVDSRDSTQTNATASITTGLRIGSSFVFSPQLELGYDDVITGGAGNTTAHFAYGGSNFTVPANDVGGAAMARVTLRGDGNFVHFALQAGGEYNSSFRSVDMKAIFRMTF